MDNPYYIYLLTNDHHTVLYVGVTNDLLRRVYEHKNKFFPSFTQRYNVHKLVHYEILGDPVSAINREKQIKSWSRRKKEALIADNNPEWKDLYTPLVAD